MNTARQSGFVIKARRRFYTVALDDIRSGKELVCHIKGRSLTPVCGDQVEVRGEREGGVIERIGPRQTLFYRSDAVKEKLIAANVTQVVAVTAPDLALDEMLLNRWLIAARASGCAFILVLNKKDLPGFAALRERLAGYTQLGALLVETSAKSDVSALLPHLLAERSVLIGQSGMGKSTLINTLVPGANADTREVSTTLDSGKHTTTAATLYPLPSPATGWIIDIPGMRVFGLAHFTREQLNEAFVDIAPYAAHCRFRDCRHLHEPGCAVLEAVREGKIHPKRLQLYSECCAQAHRE